MGKGSRKAKPKPPRLAGRPRKAGARTASGRLARGYEDDPRQTVAQARQRHAIAAACLDLGIEEGGAVRLACEAEAVKAMTQPVAREQMRDYMAQGTALDRLYTAGEITERERDAGFAYAQRYDDYARSWGLPRLSPGISAYGEQIRGTGDEEEGSAARARLCKAAWDEADSVIRALGPHARTAMRMVCINDEDAGCRIALVRAGLRVLVEEGV